jgi:hypothetical protein
MTQTSRVLARVIGPLLIIAAVGVLLNLGTYQHMIEEYSKSPSLCYLGGFAALLLGPAWRLNGPLPGSKTVTIPK